MSYNFQSRKQILTLRGVYVNEISITMQKAEIVLPWKISTVKSAKTPKIGIKTLCVKAPKIAQMVKK